MRWLRTPGSWLLLPLLLAGCDDPQRASADRQSAVPASAAPETVPVASGSGPTRATKPRPRPIAPAGLASASATASGANSAAVEPAPLATEGLLRAIASATVVKISRVESADSATIDAPDRVRQLLGAIGLSQRPGHDCPVALPTLSVSFKDGFGKRLGSLGVYAEPGGGLLSRAALSDALGDDCQEVELEDPAALDALLTQALPLSKKGD